MTVINATKAELAFIIEGLRKLALQRTAEAELADTAIQEAEGYLDDAQTIRSLVIDLFDIFETA